MSGSGGGPVLVIEDHVDSREGLTAILELADYREAVVQALARHSQADKTRPAG